VAGLVFVVLILAGFFTPDTPAADSSAEEMAAQLGADRMGHQLSLFLGFLADMAFLVFLAGLWSRLRRAEGAAGMLAALFAIAGTVFVALILVSEGLYLTLVKAAETASDPATVLPTLALMDSWLGAATVPAGVAMFAGVAGAIVLTRTLPVWLGWLAILTAALLFISLFGVFQADEESILAVIGGFGGFLLFLIWTLAASVMLLVRAGRERQPVA
jgi:hypothetical protein